jgi:citrate lyase beta subunit
MVVNQPSMCYACPMNLDPDICRSLLFVPTGNEPYLDSTLRGTANVIQLDLEDSISCDQKSQSRAGAHAAINRIHESGRVGVVRINNDHSLLSADLDAVVGPQLAGITLPKVSCAQD